MCRVVSCDAASVAKKLKNILTSDQASKLALNGNLSSCSVDLGPDFKNTSDYKVIIKGEFAGSSGDLQPGEVVISAQDSAVTRYVTSTSTGIAAERTQVASIKLNKATIGGIIRFAQVNSVCKITISDIHLRLSRSFEQTKQAQQSLELLAVKRAYVLALQGKRKEALRVLSQFVINDHKTAVDQFAIDLKSILDSREHNWQARVEQIEKFPKKYKDDGTLEWGKLKDKKATIADESATFWPTANMIGDLVTLGRRDEARNILVYLETLKRTEKQEYYMNTTYRKALDVPTSGDYVLESASEAKRFDGKSLQYHLDQGKVGIVLRSEYWCKPCKKELEELKKWAGASAFKDKFQILVVAIDEVPEDKQPIQKQAGTTYPEANSDDGFVATAFPTMFIVAPNGQYVTMLAADEKDIPKLLGELTNVISQITNGSVELPKRP